MEKSEIQEFYKNTTVFITGGTGFMGKAMIEKILRDTEVTTIYILVREKKGKSPHTRIDELFDDMLFDRLKSEQPKCLNKLEAIVGDCSIAGLGLSIMDRQKLINNVNIVFHVAATVNFTEHIKLAYNINVNGTRDVLDLAREMRKLKSIVHVSTAYSNCPKKDIDEKIYDHPLNCSDVEAVLEKMTNDEASLCTPKILGEWPNTYTFTKALAESLIKNRAGNLPIGIFRPSIVASTYREPIGGWIDNMYGATGMAIGTLSGALKVAQIDLRAQLDTVPVDTCVAGIIVTAWDVAQKGRERTDENIPVYNYVCSPENPLSFEEFIKLNFIHGLNYPHTNAIWCPVLTCTTNVYLYYFYKLFLHIIPAFFVDLFCVITGNKPRLLALYKKVHKFSETISYFCTRDWNFSNKNTQSMWKKLNKTDQQLFPFSMKTVLWLDFYRTYLRGARKYLIKEPESTLAAAIAKKNRFIIMNEIVKYLFLFLVYSLVTFVLSKVYGLIFGH